MTKEEKVTDDMLQELEDLQDEQRDNVTQDQAEDMESLKGAFAGEVDSRYGQHDFIKESVFGQENPIRTTFLSESEKGRPLFSAIFLGDMVNVSEHYLDEICRILKVENKIRTYFMKKQVNIAECGLSNKGFVQNLNVSKRLLSERKRIRPTLPEKK